MHGCQICSFHNIIYKNKSLPCLTVENLLINKANMYFENTDSVRVYFAAMYFIPQKIDEILQSTA